MTGRVQPAEPIRLVVSDIDGTLVNHAKELTPRTRAAIAALAERGVGFTVTTARPPVGLRGVFALLGMKVTAAAINGGAVVDGDLNIVEEKLLAPAIARRAVALLREQGLDPWLFTDEHWYIRDPKGDNVPLETRTIGQEPVVVDDFAEALYGRVLKVIGSCNDHPHLAACEAMLQRALGADAIATRSQAYYLDVTNPRAHKGEAVASLAKAFGVPVSAVLTIGDGTNDIPMLEAAGFGVAMGNGSDEVKAAADAVTGDCEHDGFAEAIERYVLRA
ncbi:Cof-type HAD-IIB family hydrolase [Lichenibacterium dinghuense]|uniref:Cof-type HAD-IIB family hydrolase n=1 Tax=Lichenibacterium dinghuense TaxID=2895977 RepID=UPI002815923E|nr:Cof-type HAD-IIB family hydrolase [Lichenibacterium sp. 6Y81]